VGMPEAEYLARHSLLNTVELLRIARRKETRS
jgi:hypothetical protein